ncbi:MAG: acyl-ACP--UDP-N-acetylglucosamine O-acyltransferase [Bdellovibrionia bacterium]
MMNYPGSEIHSETKSDLISKTRTEISLIHPTAIVHPEAKIDPSVQIGPWCTIGPQVRLDKGTRLISHVVIEGWTQVGEDNTFFPFSVIGAIPQDLKYKGEPTQLIIGNNNTFRESVTLNLGTVKGGGVTRIGNNCLVMAYTHVGHDCVVGNHCIIANAGALAGHVVLEDYVTMGGMCGITQFCRIGAYSYIAGQSAVERDVPPYSIAIGGRPCVVKGTNIVGLRRRGFSSDIIQKINETIKLWARPDVQREQCLLEIESQYGETPEIQQFISFIRKSETGVLR